MPLKAICRARQAPLPLDCPAKAIRSPAMLTKYSKIFRPVHSFVFVGKKDGRAPAMGLGFAREPLAAICHLSVPGTALLHFPKSRSPACGGATCLSKHLLN